MKKYISFSLAAIILLSGCAGMNTDFDCDAEVHDQCLTMEDANQRAAGNTTETEKSLPPTGPLSASLLPLLPSSLPDLRSDLQIPGWRVARPPDSPVSMHVDTHAYRRVSSTVARLWIAAWIDRDDVCHQPSVLSFAAVPDHWEGH